eukprot:SAG22_NODE_1306_length_4792_cov_369.145962_5_plen_306_part_00
MGLACMLALAAAAAAKPPVPLIIDTDMSTDCDDVGALCLANALMTRGEADLIAVVHNTGLDTGVGAISAINQWYGRPHIPIGAYKGGYDKDVRGSYVDDLVRRFPSGGITNASEAPAALAVYRAALAKAADRSVWISSIGFTTNLQALLASGPDEASPLNGTALVAAKVAGLAWMGGRYPDSNPGTKGLPSPEHNFGYHGIGPSTAAVLEGWPAAVPITFLGWEVGAPIHTGGAMTNRTPDANPCRQAYIDHSGAGNDRSSWDPVRSLSLRQDSVLLAHPWTCARAARVGRRRSPMALCVRFCIF